MLRIQVTDPATDLRYWEKTLNVIQETINQWQIVQRKWMYLEGNGSHTLSLLLYLLLFFLLSLSMYSTLYISIS